MAVPTCSPGLDDEAVITPAVREALQTEEWLAELADDVRLLHTAPLEHLELDCSPLHLVEDLLRGYPARRRLAAC